jgi:hypothetical protein
MEIPLNDKAQKRARLSRLFGLIWLIIPLIALSWVWLSNGPLEPMLPGSLSPAGIALDRIILIITRTAFFLWVGSGVAYIIATFPGVTDPRAWISIGPGKRLLLFLATYVAGVLLLTTIALFPSFRLTDPNDLANSLLFFLGALIYLPLGFLLIVGGKELFGEGAAVLGAYLVTLIIPIAAILITDRRVFKILYFTFVALMIVNVEGCINNPLP